MERGSYYLKRGSYHVSEQAIMFTGAWGTSCLSNNACTHKCMGVVLNLRRYQSLQLALTNQSVALCAHTHHKFCLFLHFCSCPRATHQKPSAHCWQRKSISSRFIFGGFGSNSLFVNLIAYPLLCTFTMLSKVGLDTGVGRSNAGSLTQELAPVHRLKVGLSKRER